MKITININKEEAKHLGSPHMFMDECMEACNILYKIQKQIDLIPISHKQSKRLNQSYIYKKTIDRKRK